MTARRARAAGFGLFGLSAAAYASLWAFVLHEPFHVGEPRPHSFDLRVYRTAGLAVLHGRPLYELRLYGGMRFTYPPLAALLLLANRLLAEPADAACVAVLNVAMLVAIVRLTPRLHSSARARGSATRSWAIAAAVSAIALWSEPVVMAVGYGQIDLLVTLLIVWDLARPSGARGRGLGVGLAAGLKLTPLLFIPYLLLAGRRRTALTAAGTFLATVAAGFAILPADSARFWGGTFLDSSRAGDVAAAVNQSLPGAIARALGTIHVGDDWRALVAAAGVAGVLLAARAARRGQDGVGFAVCALTSLLVSPVSWTHHWVLALPAVLVLLAWAWRGQRWSVLAAVGCLCLASFGYLPELLHSRRGFGLGALGLAADPYVILGCLAILATGVSLMRGGDTVSVADEAPTPRPGTGEPAPRRPRLRRPRPGRPPAARPGAAQPLIRPGQV